MKSTTLYLQYEKCILRILCQYILLYETDMHEQSCDNLKQRKFKEKILIEWDLTLHHNIHLLK